MATIIVSDETANELSKAASSVGKNIEELLQYFLDTVNLSLVSTDRKTTDEHVETIDKEAF